MSIDRLKKENTNIILEKRNEIGQDFDDVKKELYDLNSYNNEIGIRDLNFFLRSLEKLKLDPRENLRIIKAAAKKLSMSLEQVVITVDKHANTSAASIPLALNEAVKDGRIKGKWQRNR